MDRTQRFFLLFALLIFLLSEVCFAVPIETNNTIDSGLVDLDDFLDLVATVLAEKYRKAEQEKVLRFDDEEPTRKGTIPNSVAKEMLKHFADTLTDEELNMMIAYIDTDHSGDIDFEEFKNAFKAGDVETYSIGTEESGSVLNKLEICLGKNTTTHIISKRDEEAARKGTIPNSVAKEMLKHFGDTLTDEELDMMIAYIDTDHSGDIDFEEFKNAFKACDVEKNSIGTVESGNVLNKLEICFGKNTPSHIISKRDEEEFMKVMDG